MIVSRTFLTSREVTTFMNGHGLALSEITGPYLNSSGHYDIFFEDGSSADTVIDTTPGVYGVSYGAELLAIGAGVLMELGALRTAVVDEVLGVAEGSLSLAATIANTYIIPGSVVIVDGDGVAPVLSDDGIGNLVERTNKARRGTVNYGTGVLIIAWESLKKSATGEMTASYEYSSLPDSVDFPYGCELSRMVVKKTAGTATTLEWALYEDSAMTYAPILTGSIAAFPVSVDLGDAVSHILDLDLAVRGKRWLSIVPDTDGDSSFEVLLTWKHFPKS